MSSEKATKSLGALLRAMKYHANTLVDEEIVDVQELRHTIEARKQEARRLVFDEGKSYREAGQALGVSKEQIRLDITDKPTSRNLTESSTNLTEVEPIVEDEPPQGIYETIVIDPPWPMTKIERGERPNQEGFDYEVMSREALWEFKAIVDSMAANDCHMFMWATQKFFFAWDLEQNVPELEQNVTRCRNTQRAPARRARGKAAEA